MGVLDQWVQGGLDEVILPSGLRIRGRLPMVQDMVVSKVVDGTLVSAVLALDQKPVEDFSDEERGTWVRWQRIQAAAYIREVYDPKGRRWSAASVTADQLDTAPPQDVDALEDIVLRRRTHRQVTAHSRFIAGEIDQKAYEAILREEASGTIAAWSSFRGVKRSAPSGEDGRDVGDQAQPTPGPSRQVRRSRARRSPGGEAQPGAAVGG